MKISKEVIIATVTSIGGFIVLLITNMFSFRAKNKEKNAERITIKLKNKEKTSEKINESKFNNLFFSSMILNKIYEKSIVLFKETSVEKLIILYAINGKTIFTNITVCLEISKNNNSKPIITKYDNYKIGNEYRDMLKKVERSKQLIINVNENIEEDCELKNLLRNIKVNYTVLSFLARININSGDDILLYSSGHVKSSKILSSEELNSIKAAMDTISDLAYKEIRLK